MYIQMPKSAITEQLISPEAGGQPKSTPNTFERQQTFSRFDTFSRAFTLDRTFTQVFGLDNEDGFTNQLIKEYVEVSQKGNEGDIPIPTAFGKEQSFWKMFVVAGVFGVLIGICGLAFMNIADEVPKRWVNNDDFEDVSDCGFNSGKNYWIAITACTGLLVGTLRYLLSFPDNLPGLFKEINECHVEPKWAPLTCCLSAISLAGGACLGPEQALGNLGGGFATFVSEKIGFSTDDAKLVVLSGMTAALGALFPSPMLGVLMMYELGNPPKSYMESIIVLSFSGIVSFAVYYELAEKTYLDHTSAFLGFAYNWEFESWQIVTGFIIGIVSGVLSIMIILIIGINKQIFLRLRTRLGARSRFLACVLPPFIGGLFIGLVYKALPMTVGNGSLALRAIVKFGYLGQLSKNLILCTIVAKMFVLGVSMNSGFIGGFILPQIFIGAAAGIYMYILYPGVPVGLCVACFMAGVPSGICPMPFTLACLAIFLLNFGLYQTAPIFVSTITSYTLVCGSGIFGFFAQRAQAQAAAQAAAAAEGHENESLQKDEDYSKTQYIIQKQHKTHM